MKQKCENISFKPRWSFANEFTDINTGVSVVVNRSNHKVPQYSFKLGRYKNVMEEGKPLLTWIGARVTPQDIYSEILECENLDAAIKLLVEAKEWAKENLIWACVDAKRKDKTALSSKVRVESEAECVEVVDKAEAA